MPRRARIVIPEYPHHLFLRGNNRRRLFSRTQDFQRFLRWLADALRHEGCQLHQLTLMSNHVHSIPTPPTRQALARWVHSFAHRYGYWRNRMTGGSGKLFEERYKTVPILSDEQLLATTVYNDLNPVRAGLVDDPLEYPWSTYAIHAGFPERSRIPIEIWTPSPWYLGLGRDAAERAQLYREVAKRQLENRDPPKGLARFGCRTVRRPDGSRAA